MAVDHIRYDILAQEALRGVVHKVLVDAAKNGLPGEHHFYISFDTRADGVRVSPRMLAQYPEEMTVVLQHQFWDLVVTDDGFEVGISFGGVPERLAVPFAAVKGFFDPSVQFGLQFEDIVEAAAASETGDQEGDKEKNGSRGRKAPTAGKSRSKRAAVDHKDAAPSLAELPSPANAKSGDTSPENNAEKPVGGQVV